MIMLIELFSPYWDPKGHVEANARSASGFQRVTFHFIGHILPFRFFCQSPFKLKRIHHSCSECLEKFQLLFTVIAKGGDIKTAEGSFPFLLQFTHLFLHTAIAKQYRVSLSLHCIYRQDDWIQPKVPLYFKAELSADDSWTDLESYAWVKFYTLRQVMLCLELLLHLTLAVINYHLADWHISE